MKPFLLIFTFYLMLLAVQPCADMVSVNEDQKTAAEISVPSDNEECPTPDHECSPLCNCSCRQVTDIQTSAGDETGAINKIVRRELPGNAFQNDYSHQFLDSIWQPPKNNLDA